MTPAQLADIRQRAAATQRYRQHLREQIRIVEPFGDSNAMLKLERSLRDCEVDLLRLEHLLAGTDIERRGR
jgi:hypothetical protein